MTQTISQPAAACPSAKDLDRYTNGWMDETEFEHTEQHVSVCQECDSALNSLEPNSDTLTQAIRSATNSATSENADPNVADALETIRGFMDETAPSVGAAPVPQTIGSYKLIEPLGYGGMGTVYLATHTELHKQVAIKLLPSTGPRHAETQARFSREAQAVGTLDDPRIVAATDAGETKGTRYLVMEHISGFDLSRLARNVGKLSIADACSIVREIALGLSTAHAAGIVHRDIKPSNVMLDESGRVKILDFGLAQFSLAGEPDLELTTVGQLLGTLDYMAPEQADRGGVVDYRADLYSLGATLFRLLAGRAPLAAAPNQSPLEKLRLLATESVPKLSSLRDDIPDQLVQLVDELLQRHPENRPASAAHVAERLEQFVEDADLVDLIVEAKKLEVRQPPTHPDMLSVLQSPTGNSKPPRSTKTGRLLRWAVLGLMAAAGVFITLETQKGRVVIESDVANIQVRIVKDGREVENVKIKQGNESTKLWAGKYEVVIDGSTEDLVVENDSFVLKRGEIIVARVTHRAGSNASLGRDFPAVPSVDPNEPTYKDKTLTQWLTILRRERDKYTILNCIDALDRLEITSRRSEVKDALLTALKTFEDNELVREGENHGRYLDSEAFDVIERAYPGTEYRDVLLAELKSAEPTWFERVLSRCSLIGEDYDPAPLQNWLLDQLKKGPSTKAERSRMETTFFWLASTTQQMSKPHRELLSSALIKSPSVPNETWLQFGPTRQGRDNLIQPLQQEMVRRAMLVFAEADTESTDLIHATMILASTPEFTGTKRVSVAQVISKRLQQAAGSNNRFALVPVNSRYQWLTPPEIGGLRISTSHPAKANLLVELLDLAAAAGLQGKLDTSLETVMKSIGDFEPFDLNAVYLSVSWPKLAVQIRSRRRRAGAVDAGMAAGLGGGLGGGADNQGPDSIRPEDILPRLLMTHPMLEDYRERYAEAKDGQPDSKEKPAGPEGAGLGGPGGLGSDVPPPGYGSGRQRKP
ncbi:MAG: serine/threonine-protein kinase [Planctomycetaceae bacterium]